MRAPRDSNDSLRRNVASRSCSRSCFRSRDLLAVGLAANPPPRLHRGRRRSQRGCQAQPPACAPSSNGWGDGHDEVPVFPGRPDEPLRHYPSRAERDLRGLTVHQKVCGGVRSHAGLMTPLPS
jgi:hypothetical protein